IRSLEPPDLVLRGRDPGSDLREPVRGGDGLRGRRRDGEDGEERRRRVTTHTDLLPAPRASDRCIRLPEEGVQHGTAKERKAGQPLAGAAVLQQLGQRTLAGGRQRQPDATSPASATSTATAVRSCSPTP